MMELTATLLKQDVKAWNKLRESNDRPHADFIRAKLIEANLSGADLRWADLTGADLSGADLSGADLTEADLDQVVGLGSKDLEIEKIKFVLEQLEHGATLAMGRWHACDTSHCIAGFLFPDVECPGQKASLLVPTAAKYFFSSNDVALSAMKRIATGEESIWNG